jgi:carbamoyl-phosphate synthase large subunit
VRDSDQEAVLDIARYLAQHGFELLATRGTAGVIQAAGVEVNTVNKVAEGRPHIVDMIKNDDIDIIVNTTAGKQSLADSYTIRREALLHKVTYYTTLAAARAACAGHAQLGRVNVGNLQELHRRIPA